MDSRTMGKIIVIGLVCLLLSGCVATPTPERTVTPTPEQIWHHPIPTAEPVKAEEDETKSKWLIKEGLAFEDEADYLDWKRRQAEQAKPAPAEAKEEARKATTDAGDRKVEAWVMAQFYVKACLKSPGTADFGGLWGGDYQNPKTHVSYLGNNEYLVRGWVDSQNAFGATVRTDFSLKLRDEGGYSWSLIEGPVMVPR